MKMNRHLAGLVVIMLAMQLVCLHSGWAQQAATDSTGYLKVSVGSTSFFYVIVDRDYDGAHAVVEGDSLELPAGEHYITLASANFYDHSFIVEIAPNSTKYYEAKPAPARDHGEHYLSLSSFPPLQLDANVVVRTDDDSAIQVNGRNEGYGEVFLDLPPGTHDIRTVHPYHGESTQEIRIRGDRPLRLRTVDLYNLPSREVARRLGFVPGASQIYKQETVKGIAAAGLIAGTVAGAIWQHQSYSSVRAEYDAVRDRYMQTSAEETALKLGDQAEALYSDSNRHYWTRNAFIAAASLLYVANIVDGWRAPEYGFRSPASTDAQLFPVVSPEGTGVSVIIEL